MRRLLLSLASPMRKLESYERYLFIGPHPDDIEIGAGATAAKLARMGRKVAFLIALDGRYGLRLAPEGTTPTELIEIRKKEAIASASVLGVSDVRFLGLSDGGGYTMDELEDAMAKAIGDYRPDVIFAPDPCLKSECHIDHLNVGNAARHLACLAPYKEIMATHEAQSADVKAIAFYFTSMTNTYIKTSGYVEEQLKAIFSCHLSQFPEGCPEARSISMYIKLRAFFLGLRGLRGKAEGFRMLDQTRMHCFSES